ncbi:peritrophin-1-like [Toxorhynchites rutilus septentrionalis]|uniref:peritrophin-1-like n=1 Tax=Toxorhynchites rutilus septentrionalis TaxID=329112 RepID=UPI0024790644|nr:peritrophin-1-like [Toxorhynchites rutilus septentrionalis]
MKAQTLLLTLAACVLFVNAKDSRCPAVDDPLIAVHFPHPTDCSKFLTCSWGQLVEQSCPAGQLWNDARKYCDFPANVQCDEPNPPANECPQIADPEHTVFIPHADCAKFYICTWNGVAVEKDCPAGLHWNQQLSHCDYPQQAGCVSDGDGDSLQPEVGRRALR